MTPRECILELEKYIEEKYADVLALPEDIPFAPKKVQKIMDRVEDGLSIEKLVNASQKLNPSEKLALYDEIRLYVAGCIGDLIATHKYSGDSSDCENYERYLDSLLEFSESLIEQEYPVYPQEQYQHIMQVAEEITCVT